MTRNARRAAALTEQMIAETRHQLDTARIQAAYATGHRLTHLERIWRLQSRYEAARRAGKPHLMAAIKRAALRIADEADAADAADYRN